MIKQMKTPRKHKCIECGAELRKRDVRKNFPFGRKSKGRKSGICFFCKKKTQKKSLTKGGGKNA